MQHILAIGLLVVGSVGALLGCVPVATDVPKTSKHEFIVTPLSYYTTHKAKELGTRYAENLDDLMTRVQESSLAQELQFANNIQSPGGIGFFTHSETHLADDRYLQMVFQVLVPLSARDTLRAEVGELMSRFGRDLLAILLSDSQIYREARIKGYGLSFTWQELAHDRSPSQQEIALYAPKEQARLFVDGAIDQEEFLNDLVVFERHRDGWVYQRL